MSSTAKRGLIIAVTTVAACLLGYVVFRMRAADDTLALVNCGIGVLLAALIIVVPRVAKGYNLVPWARLALWIAGFAMLLWCALGLWESRIHWHPYSSQVKGFVASEMWCFVSGFLAGTLITLFLSGAVAKSRRDMGQ